MKELNSYTLVELIFTKLENKMATENEIGFSRLNLKPGDDLIIKVNTSGLSEEDSVKKLKEISDDDFLKYVTERGHRVFVTYTGVDLEILRVEPEDKVLVYVKEEGMSDSQKEEYHNLIKEKLNVFGDQLLLIPVSKHLHDIRVQKGKKDE